MLQLNEKNKAKLILFHHLTWSKKMPPRPKFCLISHKQNKINFESSTQISPKTADFSAQCLFDFKRNSGKSIHLQNFCQSLDRWNRGSAGVWALNRAVFISVHLSVSQVTHRHQWSNSDKLCCILLLFGELHYLVQSGWILSGQSFSCGLCPIGGFTSTQAAFVLKC